jgi:hypothetical protein
MAQVNAPQMKIQVAAKPKAQIVPIVCHILSLHEIAKGHQKLDAIDHEHRAKDKLNQKIEHITGPPDQTKGTENDGIDGENGSHVLPP